MILLHGYPGSIMFFIIVGWSATLITVWHPTMDVELGFIRIAWDPDS